MYIYVIVIISLSVVSVYYHHGGSLGTLFRTRSEKKDPIGPLHDHPLLSGAKSPTSDLTQLCPHLPKSLNTERSKFASRLESYAEFHRQSLTQSPGDMRTITWACWDSKWCHGVGDQLYMIQLTFLLALISERTFLIHWDTVSMRTMQFLRPNVINWRAIDGEFINKTGKAISFITATKWQVNGDLMQALYSNHTTDNHIVLDYSIPVPLVRCFHYFAKDNQTRTLSLLGKIGIDFTRSAARLLESAMFRYLFQFQEEVLAKVSQFQDRAGLLKPYTGVHIRTGFLGNKYEEKSKKFNSRKMFRDEAQWNKTLKCSVAKADALLGSDSLLFLASDSYVVKDLAARLYPRRLKTLDVELQHVSKVGYRKLNLTLSKEQHGTGKEEMINGKKELFDGHMGMWMDFILLARSHVMVVPFSGFSVLASNVCAIPDNRVFDAPDCKKSVVQT